MTLCLGIPASRASVGPILTPGFACFASAETGNVGAIQAEILDEPTSRATSCGVGVVFLLVVACFPGLLLAAAPLLISAGFFSGGGMLLDGKPGPGIALTCVGAVSLAAGLILLAAGPAPGRRPGRRAPPRPSTNLGKEPRGVKRMRSCFGAASVLAFVSFPPAAGGQEPPAAPQSDLAETGRKLSNPLSDVWALFSRFDLNFADGDVNLGDEKIGSKLIFQPVLPMPLYGKAANQWSFITRPTIPILFSAPVPTGFDTFDRKGGLGDLQLPTVIKPPTGNLLLGAGPAFLFPTATDYAFGRDQWGVGPALVVGYLTEKATFVAFGQYYFGIESEGDREAGVRDASYMNLLYLMYVNLPNAWQVGFSPTITYDHRASSGNKWNVPVGLMVSKTTLVGRLPVKFNFGVEYSVVSQDVYGERAKVVLEVIPVIPALIRRTLLGGS